MNTKKHSTLECSEFKAERYQRGDLGLMVGRNSYSYWRGPGTATQKSCGCPNLRDAQVHAGGGLGQPELMGATSPCRGLELADL